MSKFNINEVNKIIKKFQYREDIISDALKIAKKLESKKVRSRNRTLAVSCVYLAALFSKIPNSKITQRKITDDYGDFGIIFRHSNRKDWLTEVSVRNGYREIINLIGEKHIVPQTTAGNVDSVETGRPASEETSEGVLLESAWGIIANSYGGDWDKASDEWIKAAERWRDKYHEKYAKKEKPEETIKGELVKYGCGHESDGELVKNATGSVMKYYEWEDSVGSDGDKSQCWECYKKEVKQ